MATKIEIAVLSYFIYGVRRVEETCFEKINTEPYITAVAAF